MLTCLTCLAVSVYNCVDMRLSSQYTFVYPSSFASHCDGYQFDANSLSANYPTNIGLDKETAMQVPDDKVPLLVRGSKIAHFSWTMYICMIFAFKGVMLCLFRKVGYVEMLTFRLLQVANTFSSTDIWRQELLVRITSITVICSWIASVLTHLFTCHPMQKHWQVKPYPGGEFASSPSQIACHLTSI